MATDAQVAKLTTDVNRLITDVTKFKDFVLGEIAKAQAATNDPAVDALDAAVSAKADELEAGIPTPPASPT